MIDLTNIDKMSDAEKNQHLKDMDIQKVDEIIDRYGISEVIMNLSPKNFQAIMRMFNGPSN